MKGSINLDFKDEDLRKFVGDIARRWTLNTIQDVIKHVRDPSVAQLLTQLFQTAVATGASIGGKGRGFRASQYQRPDAEQGPWPSPGAQYPPPPSPGAPSPYAHPPYAHRPGAPYAPPSGIDMMEEFFKQQHKGDPPSPQAELERCVPVEANLYQEAGWTCHECGIYNGAHRSACRQCEHERCDAAPPPDADTGAH